MTSKKFIARKLQDSGNGRPATVTSNVPPFDVRPIEMTFATAEDALGWMSKFSHAICSTEKCDRFFEIRGGELVRDQRILNRSLQEQEKQRALTNSRVWQIERAREKIRVFDCFDQWRVDTRDLLRYLGASKLTPMDAVDLLTEHIKSFIIPRTEKRADGKEYAVISNAPVQMIDGRRCVKDGLLFIDLSSGEHFDANAKAE